MQRSTIRAISFIAIAFSIVGAVLTACSKTSDAPPPAAAAPAPTPEPAPASAPQPAASTETAPAPVPKPANIHAFTIGELSAMALRDGNLELPNDNKVFGVGQTPADVAALVKAAGLPTDKLHLTIQPLLVKTSDRVLLFDTGAGSIFGPGAGKLGASLAEAGVEPQGVTDIFISHSHGDHVGGLVNAEGALNFPNATIHLSQPEWAHLMGQEQFAPMIAALTPKVAAFAPQAEIIPGTVKAIEITGHTPGHSGYLITSRAASLLYVGDSMHHFVVSVQKPEWANSFDGDQELAARSRATLIADSAARGQRIYAVHFPFPGIGEFAKRGDNFVWVGE